VQSLLAVESVGWQRTRCSCLRIHCSERTFASADLRRNKSESCTPCNGIAIIAGWRSSMCGAGNRSTGNVRKLFMQTVLVSAIWAKLLMAIGLGSRKFQIFRRRIKHAEDCIQKRYW